MLVPFAVLGITLVGQSSSLAGGGADAQGKCFQRVYTTAHLTKHSAQAVVGIEAHLDREDLRNANGWLLLRFRDARVLVTEFRCDRGRCTTYSKQMESAVRETTLALQRHGARLIVKLGPLGPRHDEGEGEGEGEGRSSNAPTRDSEEPREHELCPKGALVPEVPKDIYHLIPCERVVERTCARETACLLYAQGWEWAISRRTNLWLCDEMIESIGGMIEVPSLGGPPLRAHIEAPGANCMGYLQRVAVLGLKAGHATLRTTTGPARISNEVLSVAGRATARLIDRRSMTVIREVPLPDFVPGRVDYNVPAFGLGLDDDDNPQFSQEDRCVSILRDGSFRASASCREATQVVLDEKERILLEQKLGPRSESEPFLTRPGSNYLLSYLVEPAC